MNIDAAQITVVLLTSAIGFGYFRYGRRQHHTIATACGIGLMTYPYVVHGIFWLVALGAAMLAGPFLIRQ